MSFDYYIKTTKDILTGMQILMSTGNNGGNPMVNAASVRNSGVDLSLTWRDKLGGMNYSVNLNGSYLNNEILN